jgi:hypothetical protein
MRYEFSKILKCGCERLRLWAFSGEIGCSSGGDVSNKLFPAINYFALTAAANTYCAARDHLFCDYDVERRWLRKPNGWD